MINENVKMQDDGLCANGVVQAFELQEQVVTQLQHSNNCLKLVMLFEMGPVLFGSVSKIWRICLV